jgi:hypothetical protein
MSTVAETNALIPPIYFLHRWWVLSPPTTIGLITGSSGIELAQPLGNKQRRVLGKADVRQGIDAS